MSGLATAKEARQRHLIIVLETSFASISSDLNDSLSSPTKVDRFANDYVAALLQ